LSQTSYFGITLRGTISRAWGTRASEIGHWWPI